MKNLTLELFDTQSLYAQRLAEYIGRMPDSPFIVKVHLDHVDILPENGSAGICLITSSLWEKYREQEALQDAHVILLDETGKSRAEGIPIIYKYQSAAAIYRILMDYCMENDLRPAVSVRGIRRRCDLWIVYVPCGSRRRTEEVLSICRTQSEKTPTLYINAEMVTNFPALLESGEQDAAGEAGLSELFYYMKQYQGNIGMRLKKLVRSSGGLHYLLPVANGQEISEISGEEWSMLNAGIRDETRYGTVVMDFGQTAAPAALLEQCSCILAVSGRSSWEMQLIEKFKRMICETAGSEAAGKIELRGEAD